MSIRTATIPNPSILFDYRSARVWMAQMLLISAAIVLPAVAHLTGLPVRSTLPMHWPVLLAGILYGWRSGLLIGVLSPVSNWLITGFPLPMVLPAMTVELAIYGFVTGWLRERLNWNGFTATALGIVSGRVAFIATVWLTGGFNGIFGEYLVAALIPGIIAATGQVLLMGIIIMRVKKH